MTTTASDAGTPAGSPVAPTHRQVLGIFAGLMLGMLLASLDQTIVATALPTITGDLGGLNDLSWVITSYMLAAAVSTPLYGKLGDLFGRKRLFELAIVLFLAASALCGLSRSMGQLIVFRGLQGLGAGGLIVLAQAIMAEVVSPRERGRYAGYFGALFGASSVAGPLLGGFLTDQMSWRWVFYVNLPLGALALLVTAMKVPPSIRHGNPRIDYVGSVLLTAAVTCIVLFTTWGGTTYAWGSGIMVSLAVASVVLVVLLLVVEHRVAEPVVPVHLFKLGTFNVSSSVSFITGVAMFGGIAFLPLFLQVVNGASATSSGFLLMPFMLGLLAASMAAGQVITRTGHYKVFPIAGTALAGVALYLLSTMDTGTTRTTVTVYMVLLGVGIGLSMQTLVLAVQNVVKLTELGAATSSVTFFRTMGGSIGVALFGALFNHQLAHRLQVTIDAGEASGFSPTLIRRLPEPQRTELLTAFADSLTTVFLYAVPLVLLAFALTWLLRAVPLRSTIFAVDDHTGPEDGPALDPAEPAVPTTLLP